MPRAMLRALIHRLHRLRIGTLDSFFVQLAGNFSLELGLPLGWRIVDALDDRQAALRGDSTDAGQPSDRRFGPARPFAEQRRSHPLGDAADRRGGRYALYDLWLGTPPEAWQTIPRPKSLDATSVGAALAEIAALDGFPDNRFVTARDKSLAAAGIEDWDAFISGRPGGKDHRRRNELLSQADRGPCASGLRAGDRSCPRSIARRLADQTAGTWQILAHFDTAYRQLKTADRAMRFDDVTRALAGGFAGLRVDDLAYRLDGPLGHLLLDEFQDTSLPQWTVLLPFARRVTAAGSGRSFFCVGDGKQAIYGWRGGVAEIFDSATGQLRGSSAARWRPAIARRRW